MTTPTTTVVAATDFSECAGHAAHRAALLAAQLQTTLTLVHIVNRSFLAMLHDLFVSSEQAEQALTSNAARMLDEQAAEIRKQVGVSDALMLHPQVKLGNTHDELLAAGSTAAPMVLGAHGDNPLRDMLFGSTAERLLRHATHPVLVVRRTPRGPYGRVLVPSDFSPASAAAFQLVESFAPGAAITVVHGFDVPFEGKLGFAGVPEAAIKAHRERAQREALAKLATLQTNRGGSRLTSIVERQHPVQLILEAEQSRDADLIVMGRQGQSMVQEALLGSVARRVIADAQCDVLVATGRSALP